ncbi:MAG: cupin domain-containing protein [Halioglobus sp.]|nr:cupin domain-containing protein [Halioglobus sp.]
MISCNWKLNLNKSEFLAEYWQSKALLIRGAISEFEPPVSSHELAGMALEEQVESRIVEYRDNVWQVHYGPFHSRAFDRDQPWTLLVQAVDHYLPAVAELRKLIDFIPEWRIDDIMVSYAVEGGSVGPHFDNYDVFLLQGSGERLWQLGKFCDDTTALLQHDELRILDTFDATEEHLLHCGDILYVPAGMAHWGIAQTECTTFSIGFRAPRVSDMVSRWADHLLETLKSDAFYRDIKRAPVTRPGEIQQADLDRAAAQLRAAIDTTDGRNVWFGELVTEPHYALLQDEVDAAHTLAALKGDPKTAELAPTAKLAWQHDAKCILVFVNGESQKFDSSVLPSLLILCDNRHLTVTQMKTALGDNATVALLGYLAERGVICIA